MSFLRVKYALVCPGSLPGSISFPRKNCQVILRDFWKLDADNLNLSLKSFASLFDHSQFRTIVVGYKSLYHSADLSSTRNFYPAINIYIFWPYRLINLAPICSG